jgi:hypothetical protein
VNCLRISHDFAWVLSVMAIGIISFLNCNTDQQNYQKDLYILLFTKSTIIYNPSKGIKVAYSTNSRT